MVTNYQVYDIKSLYLIQTLRTSINTTDPTNTLTAEKYFIYYITKTQLINDTSNYTYTY